MPSSWSSGDATVTSLTATPATARSQRLCDPAAYLTLPTVHFIKVSGWPIDDESQVVLASAFLIGTCAMWISDIAVEIIVRRFKPRAED
jgi:hypothetical protein